MALEALKQPEWKKGKWEWDAEEGYWCSECKEYVYGGKRIMVCSHYEVFAYNSKRKILAAVNVYSFDEAYYFIDKFRALYPTAVEFAIKYPDNEITKMEGEE